jgi:hypothetical protein
MIDRMDHCRTDQNPLVMDCDENGGTRQVDYVMGWQGRKVVKCNCLSQHNENNVMCSAPSKG